VREDGAGGGRPRRPAGHRDGIDGIHRRRSLPRQHRLQGPSDRHHHGRRLRSPPGNPPKRSRTGDDFVFVDGRRGRSPVRFGVAQAGSLRHHRYEHRGRQGHGRVDPRRPSERGRRPEIVDIEIEIEVVVVVVFQRRRDGPEGSAGRPERRVRRLGVLPEDRGGRIEIRSEASPRPTPGEARRTGFAPPRRRDDDDDDDDPGGTVKSAAAVPTRERER